MVRGSIDKPREEYWVDKVTPRQKLGLFCKGFLQLEIGDTLIVDDAYKFYKRRLLSPQRTRNYHFQCGKKGKSSGGFAFGGSMATLPLAKYVDIVRYAAVGPRLCSIIL